MTTHVDHALTWAELAARHRALAASYALYALECDREGLTREAGFARDNATNSLDAAQACALGVRLVEREPVPA